MHDPAIPRPEVDRRDERLAGQVRGDHEAAIDVGSRGGDREVLIRLEHEVGRAELPVLGERPAVGMCLGSPCGAPASAQASRMAISAAESDWSCLSFGPTPARASTAASSGRRPPPRYPPRASGPARTSPGQRARRDRGDGSSGTSSGGSAPRPWVRRHRFWAGRRISPERGIERRETDQRRPQPPAIRQRPTPGSRDLSLPSSFSCRSAMGESPPASMFPRAMRGVREPLVRKGPAGGAPPTNGISV